MKKNIALRPSVRRIIKPWGRNAGGQARLAGASDRHPPRLRFIAFTEWPGPAK